MRNICITFLGLAPLSTVLLQHSHLAVSYDPPGSHLWCHRYAIVSSEDGQQVVEKEELMERTLLLHEGLNHGDVVEVLDTWCDRSYPGSILASRAFTQVSLTRIFSVSLVLLVPFTAFV